MDDELRNNLKEFFERCYTTRDGEKKDGDRFESLDLFEEISDELDSFNNVKLAKLKEKTKAIKDIDQKVE